MSEKVYSEGQSEQLGKGNSDEWISLHVFIHEFSRLSHFIVHCIAKMPQDFRRECFFIRYWLGGPHVRIRFKGNHYRPLLENTIQHYFSRNGFVSTLLRERYYTAYSEFLSSEGELYWCENSTYRYIPYEPETERYGGSHGLKICENHFIEDSNLILPALILYSDKEIEKMLLGYCLVYFSILQEFSLYEKFLSEILGVSSADGREKDLFVQVSKNLSGSKEALILVGNRWRAGGYFPRELDNLKLLVRETIRKLLAAEVKGISKIINSILHMSFNRAGISLKKEYLLKVFAVRIINKDA